MIDRKKLGQAGEELAAHWLNNSGYIVVDRNFRCTFGELDLICQDGEDLVFVEVRLRRGTQFGSPAESITVAKQRHLYRTATFYLYRFPGTSQRNIRFDLVEVEISSHRVSLRLHKGILCQGVAT